MSSTIYDVRLRYTAEDKASKGLESIGRTADKTGKSLFGLKGILAGLSAGFAFRMGKKWLIDFNNEIESAKISLTTIGQMQWHKSFKDARKESELMVANFQELAKKSPATTADFVDMARMIAPGVAAAGGGRKTLEELTAGAITASLATGTRSDVAALDLKQMLAGTVTARDMMAQQLLAARGMNSEEFNAKSGSERLQLVKSMFNDPALKKAAEEFGKSFAGQVSTLKDQLQIALGKIGLPLMRAITREVEKINRWVEKHPVQLKNAMEQVKSVLMTGFGFVKSAIQFVVDHKDTLINLAKAFLVFKGFQLGIRGMIGAGQGVAGLVQRIAGLSTGLGKLEGGLSGVVKGLGMFQGALMAASLAAAGLQFLADRAMDRVEKNFQHVEKFGGVTADLKRVMEREGGGPTKALRSAQNMLLHSARETGLIGKAGAISEGVLSRAASASLKARGVDPNRPNNEGGSLLTTEKEVLRRRLQNALLEEKAINEWRVQTFGLTGLWSWMRGGKKDGGDGDFKPTKADVNVRIEKIEVASEDPDRFAFGAVKAFEKLAKNPTQADSTIAGGF